MNNQQSKMMTILHQNGIVMNEAQTGRFIIYAMRAVNKMHRGLSDEERYDQMCAGIRPLFDEWRLAAGAETVLASFVEPLIINSTERRDLVEMLVEHDLIQIYLASNEEKNQTSLVVGTGERLRRIPLSFEYQPTKDDIYNSLLEVVSTEIVL